MKKKILVSLLLTIGMVMSIAGCGNSAKGDNEGASTEEARVYNDTVFGENVYVFNENDNPEEIQKVINHLYTYQETNQFGDARYAVMFMPGEYKDISVDVGFYTQVLGLGMSPVDTKLPELNCSATWLGDDSNHNATCNFWRGVENVEIQSNCMFAVSQATQMRRVQIDGQLALHDNYGWASGGFLANSKVESVDSGSQQQWLSRNNVYTKWSGENWNIVMVGDDPAGLPKGEWPSHSYTKVETAPIVQEKPFLAFDEQRGYCIFRPNVRTDSVGVSWDGDNMYNDGTLIFKNEFYIANPATDTSETLNAKLAEGQHIVFTPGIYKLEESLKVEKENTILLGLGLATLESTTGNVCVETSDASGITIAGLLFEAGTTEAENLVVVGSENCKADGSTGGNIYLSDVFFRIGGTATDAGCKVKNTITINADNVVGDNFWVWRADHGDMVAWDVNTAEHGLVVNGDNVTIYALMVEHFQDYQTVWNGNGGRVYMYQSEVPYDIPGVWGKESFFVADDVTSFEGVGLGIYLYNRDAIAPIHAGMHVPDAENVKVTNIITVMLNGNPGIRHVINDAGGSVVNIGQTQKIMEYCNGEWK